MIKEPSSLRRPSDNLDELHGQLLRELKCLERGSTSEPELFRAYLHHAQAKSWQGVAEGWMNAPRNVLDLLLSLDSFVDTYLPDLSGVAAAATEIYFAIESLHIAVAALEERRVEDRLARDPSETERAVLRVLVRNRSQFLRRGDIHKRLELPARPTPARVGQLLVELHDRGLLLRIHGRAQGNPNAAFYALSPLGLEICANLGLVEDPEEQEPSRPEAERISQAARIALDPNRSRDERRIASGILSSYSVRTHKKFVLKVLEDQAQESQNRLAAQELYGNVLHELKEASQVHAIEGDERGTLRVA